ncbi:4-hydroxy-2-oxoheptanedioate aldolase [Maribacter vaceletii]|uniref:4-hydroxy-2-oxoheptanedioate aldolase n=1 Tax=Maribacter vaceletii TaxID=1206816 RepID=A0A495EEP0_9FLAO|nr:aldolase/citrate lyase family protein [Maribacter vaceletii]RKR15226.1 4-hydroxy-2-oxoheptanedioate aldolase [Maribacter vaceletii]
MKENKLKKRIEENKVGFGVISPTIDPTICEYIGLLGMDFYMIDGEHGAITASDITNMVRACELRDTTPLARIRSVDTKLILQYMDAGVMGVMMPTIDNVDDVKKLVEAVKYPPIGKRGLGPVRAADYMQGPMSQAEYVKFANKQTLVLPQIETMECVKNLPELCKIDGVDGFIIGPRDLAMSMGYYDGPGHDEVKKVLDKIFATILESGKWFGTVAGNAAQAEGLIEKGASFIMNSVQGFIKVSGNAFLEARK